MGVRRERQQERRYRLLHRLGSGGMAEVFAAEQVEPRGLSPRRVALKRLFAHLRDDETMRGLLADEIRLARLCTHPNLTRVLDAGRAQGVPYAVMEYVEGLDLRAVQRGLSGIRRRFERADAVHVAMQLCSGLSFLHELQDEAGRPLEVVHRDVTPPNILLGVHGEVKLCDFGLAKSRQQRTRTEPGIVKGKFSYLSPEAAHGHEVDARADVFAVGIVLWEMLTMCRLFSAKSDYETVLLVRQAQVPRLSGLTPDGDAVLQEIVDTALARDPDRRYPSARALHNSLAAYADWQGLSSDLGPLVALLSPPGATPVSGIRLRG